MTGNGWSDSGYEAIARLLGARAGLTFRPSQRASIEQGISRAMSHEGTSDFTAYLRCLESKADVLDDLLVQTTVGETYFFRDPSQFQVINDLILPDLCERRAENHTLRLWSAACASGEEAYSLAMLLDRKGLLSRASILGTDVSRDALNLAQQASYRDWSLRGKGKELATPYLNVVAGRYHVNSEIRQSVHFEYLNLALDNYPSTATGTRGVDLILCRNVMIYFDRATIHSVVQRFHRCLAPGGWLVTAASDPPIHDFDLFEIICTDHGMVFQKCEKTSPPRPLSDFSSASSKETGATETSPDWAAQRSTVSAGTVSEVPEEDAKLQQAKAAMDAGEYERAAALSAELPQLDEAASIHIKALANRDVARAEQACAAAVAQQPLSKELHYLHAVLLMDLNRHADAADALQRVIYLDRTLALAHFSLGTALRTLGDLKSARRSFAVTQKLCEATQPQERVPLGEDQRISDVLEMTRLQLEAIDKAMGVQHES